MKQTAVDQLRDRLFKEFGFGYSDNIHDELKEIEKAQIIEAHLAGQNSSEEINGQTEIEYYNETYNNTQS